MSLSTIKKIKDILLPLATNYEIVAFGSKIHGGERPTSDIDLAVITRSRDQEYNIKKQKDFLGIAPLDYDIRVFELFPIYLQISVILNYVVIFGDPLEISEYFYDFRKKWEDCKYRILSNQSKHYRERFTQS